MGKFFTTIAFLLFFQLTALPQPYITVTFPNGGEVLCGGTVHITWDDNIAENVEIQLFKNGVFHSSLVVSTSSDGEYTWTFSNGSGESDYLIKILSVVDSNVFDFSDSTFTIGCSINIISPNGGEVWFAGIPDTIIWTGDHPGNVTIDLYKGGVFHSVPLTIPVSDTSRLWNIPLEMISGPDFTIKITSRDNPVIFDFSDDFFTISHLTILEDLHDRIPDSYELIQNYPNPFNPITTIYYAIPEAGEIVLIIYDVLGNEIMNVREEKAAGYHKFEFDGNNFDSGVYFYRLQAGDFVETKKMILIK